MFTLNSITQSLFSSQALGGPFLNGLIGSAGPAAAGSLGTIMNITTAASLSTVELPLDRLAELIRALALGGV